MWVQGFAGLVCSGGYPPAVLVSFKCRPLVGAAAAVAYSTPAVPPLPGCHLVVVSVPWGDAMPSASQTASGLHPHLLHGGSWCGGRGPLLTVYGFHGPWHPLGQGKSPLLLYHHPCPKKCTQELLELAKAMPEFDKRACKVVGFCVDTGTASLSMAAWQGAGPNASHPTSHPPPTPPTCHWQPLFRCSLCACPELPRGGQLDRAQCCSRWACSRRHCSAPQASS